MGHLKLEKIVHMGNTVGSHRDVWFMNVRPQMELLMQGGPDNHIIVLTTLCIWIDVLYVIQRFGYKSAISDTARNRYTTSETIEWFFSNAPKESSLNRHLTKLANGLKHSGFVREGIILSDKLGIPLSQLSVTHKEYGEMEIEVEYITNMHFKDDHIVIHPTKFYIHAREKIDQMLIDAEIEN